MLPPSIYRTACQRIIRRPGLSPQTRDRLIRNLARLTWDSRISHSVGGRQFQLDMRHMYHRLMALNQYEAETVALFRAILTEGSTYCDLGAEIGYVAALAESLVGNEGDLHLFEPDPRACDRLREVFGTPANININPMACSDSTGELTLHLAGVSGQSSLEVPPPGEDTDTVSVTVLPLDDYIEAEGISQIDLLKIDIEGHEVSALRGAQKSLREGRIKSIVIEKNNGLLWAAGYSSLHMHALIMSFDFRGYTEEGSVISKTQIDDPTLENFVYFHKSANLPKSFEADTRAEFVVPSHAREALDPDYPGDRVNQCIDLARYGNVPEAIRTAKGLLSEYPELEDLRGHCSYWEKGLSRMPKISSGT